MTTTVERPAKVAPRLKTRYRGEIAPALLKDFGYANVMQVPGVVKVVVPETKTPTRAGVRVETVERDGRTKRVRIRVAKRSGKDI